MAAKHAWPDATSLPLLLYGLWTGLGIALILSGIAVYAVSLKVLNRGLRKGVLVTDGTFAIVRHPVYASWILLVLPGLSLVLNSWPLLVLPVIGYASFRMLIGIEDRYLASRFGAAYREYRLATGEIFPRLFHAGAPRQNTGAANAKSTAEDHVLEGGGHE
jgi:protein-S-isoprenylcysteine O-methyltransferase Ste14